MPPLGSRPDVLEAELVALSRALRDKPDEWLRAWRFDDATRSLVLCLHYSERDAVDDAAALARERGAPASAEAAAAAALRYAPELELRLEFAEDASATPRVVGAAPFSSAS